MIAGSGDNAAAALGRGDGHFRVSRDDREQVIELLKTAFVDERLTSVELDARVGRALASRTRADLAAVTADIPGGPNVSPPLREAARARSQPPRQAVRARSQPSRQAVRARSQLPRETVQAHGQPPAKYVARHAVKASAEKTGTARMGGAVAVAAKIAVVLMFVTSIPPLFLLLVLFCVTAVIVTVAWIQVSRK